MKSDEFTNEGWSQKYKNSINCSHPKGFSQKAHCAGKKKHNESIEMEMTCEDCGMCKTHGSLNEIKKGQKDSNGFTKCWPGKHAEGTKKGEDGGQVRNCKPNESVSETTDDPKFDKMLKDITGKKAVAKQKKADTKQQSRDAFGSMFGGGNPADALSIRKKGVDEARANTKNARAGLAKREKSSNPIRNAAKEKEDQAMWDMLQKHIAKQKKEQGVAESSEKKTMSRAAKGNEKYGKTGMKALAKAGRNGASEKTLDKIRDEYDKYNESIGEAAIAVNMKKHHQKPKHMSEDDQIDGMARGEIKAIIENAMHIQKALEHGIELDGWMYSYVTVCNDHLNSVAEQIGNPDIEEEINSQLGEKGPGLWANINAKKNRIKHGSGEHMRKPGSKGAPSNSDFKSIHAAAKKESVEEELNRQFDEVEAMMEDLAAQHGLDSDTIWDLFETVSDNELLSETAAWQKSSGKNKNGGLNQKGVNSYRREHPGSKLKTAVTTKPSKLKPGGKAAKRRKSFCARMKGMKKSRTSAKTAHDPNSRINKSLRKWNC